MDATIAALLIVIMLGGISAYNASFNPANDEATSSIVQITNRDAHDVYPFVSKDGEKLIFSSRKTTPPLMYTTEKDNSNIWSCDRDGKQLTMVTNNSYSNLDPAMYDVSSNETRVIFSSDRLGQYKLWTQSLSGKGGTTQLTSGAGNDFDPDVNESGQVLFTSLPTPRKALGVDKYGSVWEVLIKEGPSICRVDSEGKYLTILSDGLRPKWSPDGNKIAFCRYYGDNYDIYIMDKDGGNLTQLTTDKTNEIEPNWTPDGKSLVYASNSTGNYDIWKIDIDGMGKTQLTTHRDRDGAPVCSPDGKYVYFHSYRSDKWAIWRLALTK